MGHSGQKWKRLGDGSLLTEDAEVGLGHIVPIEIYTLVFASLLVLTGITIWVAQYDFGGSDLANLLIAMGIATVKAGIVTLYFMHLNWESKITWGIVIYPLFIFALILGGTLGDMAVKKQPVPAFPHAATEALKGKAQGAFKRQIQREAGTLPSAGHHDSKGATHSPSGEHH